MSTSNIIGIPTSRVSDLFIRQQMINQIEAEQTQMATTEQQLSTGYRFSTPSSDPIAAMQVISLQSMLADNTQVQTNLTSAGTYLSETDSALQSAATLLTQARATAVGAIGSTVTDTERSAAVQQLQQDIQQLVTIGNQQFNGRYLFAGSNDATAPFTTTASGAVEYSGNQNSILTYGDLNALLASNVTGDQAFGTISQGMQGTDLQPAVNYDTPLADLNQGAGVSLGSIAISDGHSTSIVNLQGCQTIGDVAAQISAHPPAGRSLQVQLTGSGLQISLDPDPAGGFPAAQDNLSVSEVAGGTTAADLGILQPRGVGSSLLLSGALDPILTTTTPLSSLLGTPATAYVQMDGASNDIVLQANSNGAAAADGTLLNGVTVHFVDDAPAAGQESADFDPGTAASGGNAGAPGTLTVHVAVGESTAQQIINAINSVSGLPFQAMLAPTSRTSSAPEPLGDLPADAVTSGGSGTSLDQDSGLQLVNDGKTYTVTFDDDKTVGDLINTINQSGAGMVAQINQNGTGISICSRLSGPNFSIGENGGDTATQLGVRTLAAGTQLADLNSGQGVGLASAGSGGTDFTISQPAQNIQLNIDLTGLTTVGQVCDTINQAAQTAGANFTAQLNSVGNGIELVDNNPGDGTITVTSSATSTAAVDLGLVPPGQTQASSIAGTAPGAPSQTLVGADVGPQTTQGVFTALLQLTQALQNNDDTAAQSAVSLLDQSTLNLNNAQVELGARQQGLDALQQRAQTDQTNLQQLMSTYYDTDAAQAASDLMAEQVAYQASLQATGSILQFTLLNYL
jgi:flagellar hook-associated protein 3